MMADEFIAEELKEIIRAARIFNPGFSEEQFQSLTELEARLADSSYLEAVSGLRKLEKEEGISLSQALETHVRLLRQNEELEEKAAAHDANLEAAEMRLRETEEKHRDIVKATQDAMTQLEELRHEQGREERQLVRFKRKAAREKQRIDEELAEYQRRADVTKEETAAASQIKAEVTRHGFTLELALGMAAEFADYTNARERLAEALKKQEKLTSYLATLETDIKTLSENRRRMEDVLSRLGKEQDQHETVLSQLKAEIAENGEVVDFYHRYVHLRRLIQYLGATNYLTFHHCTWCGALFWVIWPGNIAASIYRCPWCGLAFVEPDKNAYTALAQRPGTALQLLS
jgi:valyl-tRNA synthetase